MFFLVPSLGNSGVFLRDYDTPQFRLATLPSAQRPPLSNEDLGKGRGAEPRQREGKSRKPRFLFF